MITLETEHIAGGGAGRRQLPAATVSELEARAWIGTRARPHVPLVGHRDLLRESQRDRPAT
jgi:hypothetical protein